MRASLREAESVWLDGYVFNFAPHCKRQLSPIGLQTHLLNLFCSYSSHWHKLIISYLHALLIEAWINCCNLCYRFIYLYTACSVGRDCEMSESICECVCVMWREVHLHSALHNAAAFAVCVWELGVAPVCLQPDGAPLCHPTLWFSQLSRILKHKQHTTLQKFPPAFWSTEIWIHNIQTHRAWYLCEKCCRVTYINCMF